MFSTRAVVGPCCAHASRSLTWSSSPSATISPPPSGRFLTQPVRPSRLASRWVEARKNTPWTRPRTTRWMRFCPMIACYRVAAAACNHPRLDHRRLAPAPLFGYKTTLLRSYTRSRNRSRHEAPDSPRVQRSDRQLRVRLDVPDPLHARQLLRRHLRRVPPVL